MSLLPRTFGFNTDAVLEFVANLSTTATTTTFTFSGANIGAPSSDRLVIVCVFGAVLSATALSVTVGGTTLTLAVARNGALNYANHASIWAGYVPNGATADVVVTFDVNQVCCAVGIYKAQNVASATSVDTDYSTFANHATNLNVPAGGIVIAAVNSLGTDAFSWTGCTEDFEAHVAIGFSLSPPALGWLDNEMDVSCASKMVPVADSSFDTGVTTTITLENICVAASFR